MPINNEQFPYAFSGPCAKLSPPRGNMGSTVVEEHNSSIVNSNGGCPGGEDVMRFESCRLSSFAGKWPADAKVSSVHFTGLCIKMVVLCT